MRAMRAMRPLRPRPSGSARPAAFSTGHGGVRRVRPSPGARSALARGRRHAQAAGAQPWRAGAAFRPLSGGPDGTDGTDGTDGPEGAGGGAAAEALRALSEELQHVLVDGEDMDDMLARKLMTEHDVAWHHRLSTKEGRGKSAYVFGLDTLAQAKELVQVLRRRKGVRGVLLDASPVLERSLAYEAKVKSAYDDFEHEDDAFLSLLDELPISTAQGAAWQSPTMPPAFKPPALDEMDGSDSAYPPGMSEDDVRRSVAKANILRGFREQESARATADGDSVDPLQVAAYLRDLDEASGAGAKDADLAFLEGMAAAAGGDLDVDAHLAAAKAGAEAREERLATRIRREQKERLRRERIRSAKKKAKKGLVVGDRPASSEEYADAVIAMREKMLSRSLTGEEKQQVRWNAMDAAQRVEALKGRRSRHGHLDQEEQLAEMEREAVFGENEGPWVENLIHVDPVTKVVRGGSVMRFRALTVVGNLRGAVGFGVGKAENVEDAIGKSFRAAKKNLIVVDRYFDRALYHDLYGKHNGCSVFIYARPVGAELKAGRITEAILKSAGITDCTVRIEGRQNPYSVVLATFNALARHRGIAEVARGRGRRILTLYRKREVGI